MTEEDAKEVLRNIRAIGAEFSEVTDEEINMMIKTLSPLVAKKKFKDVYTLALALLICHKMKMNGQGDTSLGTIADASHVSSYSEGGVSVSFNNWMGGSILSTPDAEYALTIYGIQYLDLKTKYVPRISISGGLLP
ncbi:MAG: DUF4054 domain-containing protein [Clostridia bacterium]|nr:DUF4054 domain-containing protein [Clostridia bacterium]